MNAESDIELFLVSAGAAFSANLTGGISTSVAVFCHELPHELGKPCAPNAKKKKTLTKHSIYTHHTQHTFVQRKQMRCQGCSLNPLHRNLNVLCCLPIIRPLKPVKNPVVSIIIILLFSAEKCTFFFTRLMAFV